ncbi:nitronate monooxygenase [Oligella ureolytica]
MEILENLGLESEKIPLILAGGMANFKKNLTALNTWGANAVQIGSAFAVTHEGDAHENFKDTLVGATRLESIVKLISVAGLPARAVNTPFLQKYLQKRLSTYENAVKAEQRRCRNDVNCLSVCGLRDGI